jgi:hypothetical protein
VYFLRALFILWWEGVFAGVFEKNGAQRVVFSW